MPYTQPDGYLAIPPADEGKPVSVLHAWWGLNATMKAICTRLADAGFIVFAPDLYHGKVADTIEGAEALAGALDEQHLQAKAEIVQAARFLMERAGQPGAGIAVIGFSLGAYYALDFGDAHPDLVHAVVLFYGTGGGDFGSPRTAYLGHFAEQDEYEPQENVEALEAALQRNGRSAHFYRYPDTGHWFFEADRTDAFNEAAANLAWQRTLEFLRGSSPA